MNRNEIQKNLGNLVSLYKSIVYKKYGKVRIVVAECEKDKYWVITVYRNNSVFSLLEGAEIFAKDNKLSLRYE